MDFFQEKKLEHSSATNKAPSRRIKTAEKIICRFSALGELYWFMLVSHENHIKRYVMGADAPIPPL